jgi:hypothetical protein
MHRADQSKIWKALLNLGDLITCGEGCLRPRSEQIERRGWVPAPGWVNKKKTGISLDEMVLVLFSVYCPNPASLARIMASARSATCNLEKIFEIWFRIV